MARRIEDQLDQVLEPGGRTGDVPQEVAELASTANEVRRLSSQAAPKVERRDQAFSNLQTALTEKRLRQQDGAAGRSRWRAFVETLSQMWLRPGLTQAAVALVAIVLFGGVLLGASAAGADITQPIRILFDSESEVKAVGVITDLSAGSIVVRTDTESVEVTITDDTQITDADKNPIMLDELAIGQPVEIKGALQPDGAIRAFRIRVER